MPELEKLGAVGEGVVGVGDAEPNPIDVVVAPAIVEVVVVAPAIVEVVDDPATVVVVVAVGRKVVVVVAPATVVVVAIVVEVVVVTTDAATAVQVRPDGTSAASATTVICAFQYLSSWVADAGPSVHAYPMLYVPAGRNAVPSSPMNPNDIAFSPISSPPPPAVGAIPVSLFTHDEPALVNSG